MNENKNEELILGITSKSIKMDLLRFKDDFLQDLKLMDNKLNKKYSSIEESLNEKINKFELKIKSFGDKLFELSNLINSDISLKEKVESFEQFKEEMRNSIFTRKAKYFELEKKVDVELNRINGVLLKSVIYPGIFGPTAKFQSFHDFIDYVLNEISQLELFKDKSGMDLNPFKRKIEQNIETFKIQINNLSSKEFTINSINESEENIKSIIKLYDESLKKIKFESMNNNFSINKKIDELNRQMELLNILKNEFKPKEDDNNEIIEIKNEIININSIIKELLSFHPTIKKGERRKSTIISGVKQYIKGNINANELSSMKKFIYNTSKTNIKENDSPKINHSPFPSPPSIKMKNSFDNKLLNKNISTDNYNDAELFKTRKSFQSNISNIERKINNKDKNIKKEYNNEDIINTLNDNVILIENKELENLVEKPKDFEEKGNKNYVVVNEENEKNMKLFSLFINHQNDKNKIRNNLLKEKITNNYNKINTDNNKLNNFLINRMNNSYDFENKVQILNVKKKINKNEMKTEELYNREKKSSNRLNISKPNDYSKLFKPYKIEISENNNGIDSKNLKYNGSFSGPSKTISKQINNRIEEEDKLDKVRRVNINKTYTNFPKLNKELLDQKAQLSKESKFTKYKMMGIRNLYNIGESSNSENKEIKVVGSIKKPKKILLTSPDNIPPNQILKRKKRKNKTNNLDKQFKIAFNEINLKDKPKKAQSRASLYELISTSEELLLRKNKNYNNKNV